MSTCRSCGHTIYWATTDEGKAMPIDPPTTAGGNLFSWRGADGKIHVSTSDPQGLAPEDALVHLTQSHFASCPNADTHRRRR